MSAGAIIDVNNNIQTIGDLLKAINPSGLQVLAEINDTGDGIVIRDANGGSGSLKIAEAGSTTAADLNMLGAATTHDSTQVIDGSMTRTIDLSAIDPQIIGQDTKLSELNGGDGVARVSSALQTAMAITVSSI